MCVGVLSVGLGPGLDSMSPARSRRSASHAAGTHGWLPQKTGRPGLRRGGVGGYNLHSVPPNSPPDCGTVAHQPRAGCIRLVQGVWSSSSSCHQTVVFHLSTQDFAVSLNLERSSKMGALQHVHDIFCRDTAFTCCVSIEVLPFLPLFLAACVTCA